MRRPLFCFAVCFALALAVLQFIPKTFELCVCIVCGIVSLFLILFTSRDKITKTYFAAFLALFFAGGLLFVWNHCYIEPVYYFHEKPSVITGYITDLESCTDYGYKYTLKSERIESGDKAYTIPFKIALYTNEILNTKPYERITVTAVTKLPDEADSDKDMDTRAYYRSKGIYLTAVLKSDLLLHESGELAGNSFSRGALMIKKHVVDALFSSNKLSYENAALVSAVTTNYKGRLSDEQKDAYSMVGLSHMLATSGMHLSILVFGIMSLFSMMKVRRKLAVLICILIVIAFAAVAGFSVSIIRSGVMFIIMSLGYMLDESYDAYTSLGFAALLILFQNPFAIDDVGFILSAASTLGILLFAPPLGSVLLIKRKGFWWSIINYFIGLICVTLASTSVAVPFNMFIFDGISIISPISNILVVPLLPFIFILCVLTAAFTKFTSCWIFESILEIIGNYISNVADALSVLPFAYLTTEDDMYYIWIAFAAAVIMICIASNKTIKRSGAVCIILSSLLCVSMFSGQSAPLATYESGFRLTVMDVGQGQCVLLQSGGRNIVIDCGTSSYGYDAGRIAAEYLKRNKIYHLDAVIISHYHDDHANGVGKLISNVKTDTIIISSESDSDGVKDSLLTVAKNKGIKVTSISRDCVLDTGDAVVHIYADHMYEIGESGSYNANEKNLAVYVESGESSALIEGDLTGEDEGYLAERGLTDCDVLLVAHHGSKYSTYADFLNMSTPHAAVISVGSDNTYGHPAQETLFRLDSLGAKVWRTDKDGTVTIDTSGDGEFLVYRKKK